MNFGYLLILGGLMAVYEGVTRLVQGAKLNDIYEESRRERVRRLNQLGDTEV